jgi:DNA-binding response OmpR family regulator
MRILVVDDEIHVASTLADAIRSQGHEVAVAHDAEEALVLLARYNPDALMLDITLGELSGVDLLRRLRQSNTRLPVVVITGHASGDQLDEARRLGVTDIIEKPFFLNRLTEALTALARSL